MCRHATTRPDSVFSSWDEKHFPLITSVICTVLGTETTFSIYLLVSSQSFWADG